MQSLDACLGYTHERARLTHQTSTCIGIYSYRSVARRKADLLTIWAQQMPHASRKYGQPLTAWPRVADNSERAGYDARSFSTCSSDCSEFARCEQMSRWVGRSERVDSCGSRKRKSWMVSLGSQRVGASKGECMSGVVARECEMARCALEFTRAPQVAYAAAGRTQPRGPPMD